MSEGYIYLDAHSRFLSLDGMQVHFRRQGAGPAVVLLHGSGSSLHCFDEVVAQLARTHELIRLDLPGFGFTGPRPDGDYRIDTYVRFLKQFTSALSIGAFTLAGNSLGGNIAWNYALNYPQDVQQLILMNATGYPEKSLPMVMQLAKNPVGRALLEKSFSRDAIAENLSKLVGARMSWPNEMLIERVFRLSNLPGNLQAFIDFAATDQRDRSAEICTIQTPTRVLRGEHIDSQHFTRDIANSIETVCPDVGHLLPDEAPDHVVAAIKQRTALAEHPTAQV
ncbi:MULTISPECIES: alpha/beta fold hydrolase [Pseudomonas syringae group]|nr:alpha/beta hydrolase [Pseudomonas syringae group genomosp. 3]